MKLKKLLKGIPVQQVKGPKEIEITGVCAHSKLVAPGNLFIAKRGSIDDGSRYIPEAIANGAIAILTDIFDPSLHGVTQIVHPDLLTLEGKLVAQYYDFPSEKLYMVGITGTNGKTTASYLIKHLLDHFHGPCGLIGTIAYIIGKDHYQAVRTTPDVESNHKMLREMCNKGGRSAVMEVTSHALVQGRVRNIAYDVAVFTNLSQDHLDYHKTMESYSVAKNQLFRSLDTTKTAVVNFDDPWHKKILQGCEAKILTFGLNPLADLCASDVTMNPSGTSLILSYKGSQVACSWPLIGRFNVYNCLAAVAVLLSKGLSLEEIAPVMKKLPPVPGRLEPVKNALGLKIYVDYAHSDDALKNVLECLQEVRMGRIITVFGCGGDRDREKRPKMAAACEELSDFVVLTTDNPRTEDPIAIIQQALEGFQNTKHYHVEPDRQKAIAYAIEMAELDDIILIAGKGHEPYQVFAHKTIEFDDRKVATELCDRRPVCR